MGRNERRMPAQVILQPNFNRNQRKITLLLPSDLPDPGRRRTCTEVLLLDEEGHTA